MGRRERLAASGAAAVARGNPKSQIRNPKQIQKTEIQMTKTAAVLDFCPLDFLFV
jgi:hypothetical protein